MVGKLKGIKNKMLGKKFADKSEHLLTSTLSEGIGVMHDFFQRLKGLGFEPQNIYDVGAHECTWSLNCSSVFQESNYFLFEPQLEKEDFMKKFCSEYPGSRYFLNGIGDKVDELELTIWEDKQGTSFRPSEINLELNLETRKVKVETLDNLIQGGLPIPELIKIDVQGYELNVIKGASSVYNKTELFIIEVSLYNFMESHEFSEIIEHMKEIGYVVYDIVGFARRPYDNALGQLDVVFARENGVLRKHKKWA